jgi:hypothetical protein
VQAGNSTAATKYTVAGHRQSSALRLVSRVCCGDNYVQLRVCDEDFVMLKKFLSIAGIGILCSVAWFIYKAYWEDPNFLNKEVSRYNFEDVVDINLTSSCIAMLRDMPIRKGMTRGELCGCSSNSIKNDVTRGEKILLTEAFQFGSEKLISNPLESAMKYLIFNNKSGDFVDKYISEIGFCADRLAARK